MFEIEMMIKNTTKKLTNKIALNFLENIVYIKLRNVILLHTPIYIFNFLIFVLQLIKDTG
jgi:hypothetical protein